MRCRNTDDDEALNALREEVASLEATLPSPYYRECERLLERKKYLEDKKARLDEGELPHENW